jgi:hypothetical protein
MVELGGIEPVAGVHPVPAGAASCALSRPFGRMLYVPVFDRDDDFYPVR